MAVILPEVAHPTLLSGSDPLMPRPLYDYDALGRLDAVRAVARNGEAITPEVTDYVYGNSIAV